MQFLKGWGVQIKKPPRGEYGGLRWVGLPTPSFHTGGSVYGGGSCQLFVTRTGQNDQMSQKDAFSL